MSIKNTLAGDGHQSWRSMTSKQLVAARKRLRQQIHTNHKSMLTMAEAGGHVDEWFHAQQWKLRGSISRITTILRDRWDDPESEP